MSLSNFLESATLTWMMGNYTFYVAYGTTAAGEDGSTATEPSGGTGYAREAYGAYTITNDGDDYYSENDSIITFDTATSSQGTITHFYFYDALTVGNFLGSVSLAELGLSDVVVISGTYIYIPAQKCKVTLD